jgi:hypothetical protein
MIDTDAYRCFENRVVSLASSPRPGVKTAADDTALETLRGSCTGDLSASGSAVCTLQLLSGKRCHPASGVVEHEVVSPGFLGTRSQLKQRRKT